MLSDEYPIILEKPIYLPNSAWHMHIPFAFFIVSLLRPTRIMELGVYTGCSFLAFLQAVNKEGLECLVHGVDTFMGDPHSGSIESNAFGEVIQRAHELGKVNETWEISVADFSKDGSYEHKAMHYGIGILHIDGHHSYESVKEAFDRNHFGYDVVIFHDTQEDGEGWGVGEFFNEIKDTRGYGHYEFKFGHGLGIVAIKENLPTKFYDFLKKANESNEYEELFYALGASIGEI